MNSRPSGRGVAHPDSRRARRDPRLRCLIGALGATALCDRGTATGEGNDTVTTAENLIGSPSADTLVGNRAANRLEGRAGNDNISARAGDDTLAGGPGADRCDGGTGAETTPRCESPIAIP